MEFPQKSQKAVFTFGRFQPPTKGHGVLIKEVARIAEVNGADGFVFVSSSINKPKYFSSKKYYEMLQSGDFKSTKDNENPLDVATKIEYLLKMYPDTNVTFVNTTTNECTTLPSILRKLEEAGYTDIQMVVGSDRVNTFSKVVPIPVLAAGETRNLLGEASSNLKSVSGTKMRTAAVKENIETFSKGVKQGNMTNKNVEDLMKKIRSGLGYDKKEGGTRRGKRSKKSARTMKRK